MGNARTFLVNWALAKQRNWRIVLRLEDLDSPRVKPDAAAMCIDTLAWLGIDWEGDELVQSRDLGPYKEALHTLANEGLVYQCSLSRKEIQAAASAPHTDEHELVFPAHLRPSRSETGRWSFQEVADVNYRYVVHPGTVDIHDEVMGHSVHEPHAEIGDFVVWTKRGMPAYQLAVVVDDIRQQVTDVVRGDDLLRSAARQTLLYESLGGPAPRWWHLPLVLGPDGRRLAKRHGDTRISTYRELGVPAEKIIGLLARWSGITENPTPMTARQFANSFDIATLPRSPVVLSEADLQWLL